MPRSTNVNLPWTRLLPPTAGNPGPVRSQWPKRLWQGSHCRKAQRSSALPTKLLGQASDSKRDYKSRAGEFKSVVYDLTLVVSCHHGVERLRAMWELIADAILLTTASGRYGGPSSSDSCCPCSTCAQASPVSCSPNSTASAYQQVRISTIRHQHTDR